MLQHPQARYWPTYISLLGAAGCPGQSHLQALGQTLPLGPRGWCCPSQCAGQRCGGGGRGALQGMQPVAYLALYVVVCNRFPLTRWSVLSTTSRQHFPPEGPPTPRFSSEPSHPPASPRGKQTDSPSSSARWQRHREVRRAPESPGTAILNGICFPSSIALIGINPNALRGTNPKGALQS